MRSLDPDEESVMRQLEEQMCEDDPRLAEQVQVMRPGPLARLAPTAWRPGVFAVIGGVLLTIGAVLGDGSAVLGGLLACILAWLRGRWLDSESTGRTPHGRGAPGNEAPR